MNIITHTSEAQPKYPVGEYLKNSMDYIAEIAPLVQEQVKHLSINFWVQGSSGAILAALLSNKLTNYCNILHVKKEGEVSHNSNAFGMYGKYHTNLNIIIDDFSISGSTLNRIWEEASKTVCSINYLIINHLGALGWNINFVPNNLIIRENHFSKEWIKLQPTRLSNEDKYSTKPTAIDL